jgi:hypothetical protein
MAAARVAWIVVTQYVHRRIVTFAIRVDDLERAAT